MTLTPASPANSRYLTKQQYSSLANEWIAKGGNADDFLNNLVSNGYVVEGFDDAVKQANVYKDRHDYKQPKTFRGRMGKMVRDVVGAAADSTSGIADLALSGVSNVAERGAKQFGNEPLAQKMDAAEKLTKQQVGDVGQDKDSTSYNISKAIFDVEQLITGSGLIKGATKATWLGNMMGKLRTKLGLGGKLAAGAIEGAGDAIGFSAISDGDLPSGREMALGAGVGAAFPMVSAGLKKISDLAYDTAFGQATRSLGEKALGMFGKKPGELIKSEGLKSWSVKGMQQEIGGNMQRTYSLLKSDAAGAAPVAKKQLGNALKGDMLDKLGDGLNTNTPRYQAIKNNIDDIVDFFVGKKGNIEGDEIVALVKDLNTQIPAGALKKSELALDAAKTSTAIKTMKNGLKDYLDKDVGTKEIVKLYGDYSREKLISDILSNLEVRKTLGRSLLGSVVGGASVSADNFANGDFGGGFKDLVVGALVGGLLARYSTDPDMLLRLGKILDNIGGAAANATPFAGPASSLVDNDDEEGYE